MSIPFPVQFQRSNPFDDNRVTTIDGLNADVPEIHERAFALLQAHAEKAAPGLKGRGVLVSGSAGIGKSHLLARFGQWARTEKYPFVYLLNLQAGADELLRSILRATISVLSRDYSRAPAQSRLYRLISSGVRRSVEIQNGRFDASSCTRKVARQAFGEMLQKKNVDPSIASALWLVFDVVQCHRLRIPADMQGAMLAISWLSGDTLDVAETRRFGGRATSAFEDGAQLSLEEIKDVLRAICVLAETRERCLILCFDQVDTLSEDQVQSWSAGVHALLDLCPGLLVVTSGVDETFLRWTARGLVSTASWDDRIRQFPILLSGISGEQGRVMLERRFDNWFRDVEQTPDVVDARNSDRFFPVGKASIQALLKDSDGSDRNDLRPRDVIRRVGAIWDREAAAFGHEGMKKWWSQWQVAVGSPVWKQGPVSSSGLLRAGEPVISMEATIAKKLADQIQRRLVHQQSMAAEPAHVIGLIRAALSACLRAEDPWRTDLYKSLHRLSHPAAQTKPRPVFSLIVEQKRNGVGEVLRTGVVYCEVTTGNSATSLMKRLKDELKSSSKLDRIVLIEDENRPLELARTGAAVLEFLERDSSRFNRVRMSPDALAELDALEFVAGLARSGDLTTILDDGTLRAISEDDVRNYYHQTGRYRSLQLLVPLLSNVSDAAAIE